MNGFVPRVVDISHHNQVTDLRATARADVWGVIHKSSQGRSYRDPDYAARRSQAKAAGLLWGAYHFNDGSDVAAQVDWFLKCAQPDDHTLLVLDFEDNPKSNMSVQQAVQFLRLLEQKTGRKGAIYSGNRLKETLHILSSADRAYVCSHRLWLCQYGPRASLPIGFARYWLWQYTGDGIGQPPHNVAGIVAGNAGIDLNIYDGTREQLIREWTPAAVAPKPAVDDEQASAHSRQAEADADEGTPEVPHAFPASPAASDGNLIIETKKKLDELGYHEFGILNSDWGGRTVAAIAAYKLDRGMSGPAEIDDALSAQLNKDIADKWRRPQKDERANATVSDLAPHNETIKQNWWTRLWAKIVAIPAGISAVISGVMDKFPDAKANYIDPAMGFFADVPGWLWFVMAAGAAAAIWIGTRKADTTVVKQFQDGRLLR